MSVPTGAAALPGAMGGRDILGGHRDLLVSGFGTEPGLALVLLDEIDEFGSAGSAAGHDRSGHVLAVLDVDVGVHRHSEQVVGGIAFDDGALTAHAPVVRQTDLVDGLPPMVSGVIRFVTSTRASMAARGETRVAQP